MDFLELSQLLKTHFRLAELPLPVRYRRVYINLERMMDILQNRITIELPEDATIYGMGMSEDNFGMYLLMRSEKWDIVPEGQMIPIHNLFITLVEPAPVT